MAQGLLSGKAPGRLADWPGLAGLEFLTFLGGMGLTNAGLRRLAGSPYLSGLRELAFVHNGYALDYTPLAESLALEGLAHLTVDDSRLAGLEGDRVRAALRTRFGERLTLSSEQR